MEKKFKNISYDLSQNLVLNKEFARLNNYSLIQYIVKHLKNSNIIQELLGLNFEVEDSEIAISLFERLLEDIYSVVHVHFSPRATIFEVHAKFTIDFVLLEIFNFLKRSKVYIKEDLPLFLRHLVITSQGTVNIKKTVLRCLKKEQLPSVRKFRMAAKFFLEEEVVKFFEELSEKEKAIFAGTKVGKDYAVSLWKYRIGNWGRDVLFTRSLVHVNNENNEFSSQSISEDEFYIHIFMMAVKDCNESAVYFLWDIVLCMLEEREEIIKKILSDYMESLNHVNIVYYLIFEIEKEELLDFFNEYSKKIMILKFMLQRCGSEFLKVLVALKDHFDLLQYAGLLTEMLYFYLKRNSDVDFEIIKNIMCKMSTHHHQCLLELKSSVDNFYDLRLDPFQEQTDEDGGGYGLINLFYDLLKVPFEVKNIYFVDSFFKNLDKNSVFVIFLSNWGLDLLEVSIRKCNFHFIEEFFTKYFSEEQKSKIIERFLRSNGYKIFERFLINEFHTVNGFTKWLSSLNFFDKNFLMRFLVDLLLHDEGNLIKQILFGDYPNNNSLILINQVLEWIADEIYIGFIKSKILLHSDEEDIRTPGVKCYIQVSKLFVKSEWIYLHELIKWKGCTKKDKRALGNKLLEDSDLFEKMVKKNIDPSYYLDFCNFIIGCLCINDRSSEYKLFKLRVFSRKEIYINLVTTKKYSDIIEIIEWWDPTTSLLRPFYSLIHRLSKTLDAYENDNPEEKEKRGNVLQWIEKKLEG